MAVYKHQQYEVAFLLFVAFWAFVLPQNQKVKHIEVRIRGDQATSGVVEIRENTSDVWGTVCADFWDNADATVVCRMLGYKWGIGRTQNSCTPPECGELSEYTDSAHTEVEDSSSRCMNGSDDYVNKNRHDDDNTPMFINDVQCYGNETSLADCPYAGWIIKFCWSFQLGTVECSNQSVKLTPVHGMNSSVIHGAVEVRTAYGYQPVCDADWNDVDADVVCRELGKVAGKALCCSKLSPYKPYIYTTYGAITRLNCSGAESSLTDCQQLLLPDLCPKRHLASAVCYDQPIQNVSMDYSIRLSDPGSPWWGTVEVRHLGIWGGICTNSLNDDVATIICKESGYSHGISFGRDASMLDRPVWVTDLNCTGNATRLEQCVSSWGDPLHFCKGFNKVLCTNTVEDAPVISLSNGTYGRVDITFGNKTGTICDVGWSNVDAEVVCKQLGFSAGTALSGSYYGAGSGPVYLSDVDCNGPESNIWECTHSGWQPQEQTCENHTHDASVVCHNGTVRLVAGDHSHGIVKFWNGAVWYVLCGSQFSDDDAGVVCRQLGFKHGVKLPMASYGTYFSMTYGRSVDCVGNETSIMDCPVFSYKCAKTYNTEYAAVSCSDKPFTNDLSFKIDGGGPGGDVIVVKDGLSGYICDLYWDDKDADVLCRQVGYTGGVAATFISQSRRPYLLSEVHCDGTQTSLLNCRMGHESCNPGITHALFDEAGVYCYKNKAISLRLHGPKGNSGVVEVVTDMGVGTVCEMHIETNIANNNAIVVCKQLGFNTGVSSRAFGPGTGDVMLVSPQCLKGELSLWMCKNSQWGQGSVPSECRNHTLDMGVICFKHVQLAGGSLGLNKSFGFVKVHQGGSWRMACAQDFSSKEAEVVCRELGFHHAQVLPGQSDYTFYTYNVTCRGSEQDVALCDVSSSRDYHCDYTYEMAYVTCADSPFSEEITALTGDVQPSMAVFSKYDQNVTVCASNWSDASARVACRERGFKYGYVFGANLKVKPTAIVEVSISCYGNESRVNDCRIGQLQARSKCPVGWLLCSDNQLDFEFRLVDEKSQPTMSNSGRLEVSINGTWGRVCDLNWTALDARVVCRQMGFVDGQPLRVPRGPAGPVWFQTVTCGRSETSLVVCPNSGLGFTSCRRDVGVSCSGTVHLHPNSSFGAVQIYNDDDNGYSLVCADYFDDLDAHVICRQLNYLYGISMCCSPFGPPLFPIGVTKLQCTADDIEVQTCAQDTSLTYCPSRKYASVVCSDTSPNTGYAIHLSNGHFGVVQIEHMNHRGLVCSDGFDNNDARVICREKGYSDGIGYTAWDAVINGSLRWLSDVNCSGSELYLSRCTPLLFGDLSSCSNRGVASVMCFKNKSSGLEVRLVNESFSEGVVEVAVNGKWGLICNRDFDDADANVLCHMLGYVGGVRSQHDFQTTAATTWTFSGLRCGGDEESVLQCPLEYVVDGGCQSAAPAAVKCYQTVRLTPEENGHYGRVDMYIENNWVAVCDNNFTDDTAVVVCRQLGFVDGRAQCCSAYGHSEIPIGVTMQPCLGYEKDVFDCGYSSGMCSTQTYASVFCSNTTLTEQGIQVKLKYPSNRYHGTILVNAYGYWGSICNNGWDDESANVSCRQMGWTGGVATQGSRDRTSAVLVNAVRCSGNERHLDECMIKSFGSCSTPGASSTVDSLPAAGVLCYNKGTGIRLTGGNSFYGRVEIGFDNQWGVVCDTSGQFAVVACHQLGFQNGAIAYSHTECIFCSKHQMMGGVKCEGSEGSVFRCEHDWYNSVSYCRSVHVKCWNSVYLASEYHSNQGQVFVHNNRTVGAVCAEGWSPENTQVTCRELGFEDGYAMCCGLYTQMEPKFYNFQCTGSEKLLTDCPYTNHTFETCKLNTVAVACYTTTPSKDFMWTLGGGSYYGGEVLVKFMNVAGKICPDDWTHTETRVACRELGFVNGSTYTHYLDTRSAPYWTTRVNCTGEEESLVDCHMAELGSVRKCHSRHSVGIICFEESDIFFWISNGNNTTSNTSATTSSSSSGRLDVIVDGQWGTVCSLYFSYTAAAVTCRGLGYTTGTMTSRPSTSAGPAYKTTYRCTGQEKQISDCPHHGLTVSNLKECRRHSHDVFIECIGNLKLGGEINKALTQGPVRFNYKGTWYPVCDTDFTDVTARRVCQDLGFLDGRALCCSAFDTSGLEYELVLAPSTLTQNISMQCQGGEETIAECVKVGGCKTEAYASVVCLTASQSVSSEYHFSLANNSADGQGITVTQFGTQGHICDTLWDDRDAKVFCRSQGYHHGIAYHYHPSFMDNINPVPYWVSGFNCSGDEDDLTTCPFNDRLSLGSCLKSSHAAALCFNRTTEIKYRLADGNGYNQGRVEMNVDGVWGSVCDRLWDDREAGVLCRQLGFHDGYALSRAHYGVGTGPVWLSYLQCRGTESSLHQCTHSGFNDRIASTGFSAIYCSTHLHDASVFCIKDVRLSEGPNTTQGAVEIFTHGQWMAVCDDGFDDNAAKVVCRILGFKYGIPLAGSRFDSISSSIGIMSLSCLGTEENITACRPVLTGQCGSAMYVSVTCQNKRFIDDGFHIRIAERPNSTPYSGMIEVKSKGVWGAVCLHSFEDVEAAVACRQLGFSGGISYQAPQMNKLTVDLEYEKFSIPVMVMWNVQCRGGESSLNHCEHRTDPNITQCSYSQGRAGVICYKKSGIQFELVHGNTKDEGILQIQYDGQKGYVCDLFKSKVMPKVACHSLGYIDGLSTLPQSTPTTAVSREFQVLFNVVLCHGDEDSIARCRNDGFRAGIQPNPLHRMCIRKKSLLSVHCFHQHVAITNIRLADGSSGNQGRVEVYLQGPNQWGTICDDLWDDRDATVVCRQMGYTEGEALRGAAFGQGIGPVWLSALSCNGTEPDITTCRYYGFRVTRCSHYQDASVICQGPLITSSSTTTMTTTSLQTSSTSSSAHIKESTTTTYSGTTQTATETPQGRSGSSADYLRVVLPAILVPLVLLVAVVTAVICYRHRRSGAVSLKHTRLRDENSLSDIPGGPIQLEEQSAIYFANRSNDDVGFSNPVYGKDEFLNLD